MRPTLILSALACSARLAGCVETTEEPAMTFAPTAADRETPAYKACVTAIAQTTGRSPSDIAVFDYIFSEAGTRIQATVAGAEAPWNCLSSNGGVVADVMYTGSEGAL